MKSKQHPGRICLATQGLSQTFRDTWGYQPALGLCHRSLNAIEQSPLVSACCRWFIIAMTSSCILRRNNVEMRSCKILRKRCWRFLSRTLLAYRRYWPVWSDVCQVCHQMCQANEELRLKPSQWRQLQAQSMHRRVFHAFWSLSNVHVWKLDNLTYTYIYIYSCLFVTWSPSLLLLPPTNQYYSSTTAMTIQKPAACKPFVCE